MSSVSRRRARLHEIRRYFSCLAQAQRAVRTRDDVVQTRERMREHASGQ